jgi:hypothetical protein
MSIKTSTTRIQVANHKNISFTNFSQKSDLLDTSMTNTNLIAILKTALDQGFVIQVTSVRSDHGDDSCLGPPGVYNHGHAHGYALDCWCEDLQSFVQHLCSNPMVMKIGLGGPQAQALQLSPGATVVFNDNG